MDYKFRGRDKNGVWHYGFLNYSPIQTAFFIHVVEHTPPTMQDPCGDVYSHSFEIDPETVGQYTGVKDKNGREIYEGDIVLYKANQSTDTSIYKTTVKWGKKSHGWTLKVYKSGSGSSQKTKYLKIPTSNRIEVIGNIHDNPELLNND